MGEQTHFGADPLLKAMLLCDVVIAEQGTNKKSLIGIFDRLIVDQLPVSQRLFIYIRLMDAQGAYKFKVDFIDVDRDKLEGSVQTDTIKISDPLRAFEIVMPALLEIRNAGLHEFRLYGNEAYIGNIAFQVIRGTRVGG